MAESGEEYIREECLENEEMRKIFVVGIPSDAQDDAFKSFFESVSEGKVSDSHIVRKEGQSEKKTLIGFVTFETSELVDEVLLKRGSLCFEGKELEVSRAVPKTITWVGAHEKTKKVFIANLPKDTKEEDLMAYLKARHPKKYGTIESIQLIKVKNPDGSRTEENKGYGFIFVSSEDLADKMAIQHATFTFGGRKIEMKKNVAGGGGEGGRGRGGRGGMRGGRGGGDKGMRGGRGGGQFQQGYGGGFDGGYGGAPWDGYAYGGGYDSGYGGGYGGGFGGGYGGGYGEPVGAPGGRGRGRGGNRFQPY